mmetsp:Transcript_13099/g.38524  ORF Transcript_13099/g.38524 Transcript_13099/m.38524 type:complete len:1062 (-) Transcript_13099:102-3287(-)
MFLGKGQRSDATKSEKARAEPSLVDRSERPLDSATNKVMLNDDVVEVVGNNILLQNTTDQQCNVLGFEIKKDNISAAGMTGLRRHSSGKPGGNQGEQKLTTIKIHGDKCSRPETADKCTYISPRVPAKPIDADKDATTKGANDNIFTKAFPVQQSVLVNGEHVAEISKHAIVRGGPITRLPDSKEALLPKAAVAASGIARRITEVGSTTSQSKITSREKGMLSRDVQTTDTKGKCSCDVSYDEDAAVPEALNAGVAANERRFEPSKVTKGPIAEAPASPPLQERGVEELEAAMALVQSSVDEREPSNEGNLALLIRAMDDVNDIVDNEDKGEKHRSPKVAQRRKKRSCGKVKSWDERTQELLNYQEKHGHMNVPQKCDGNPSLGFWVSNIRQFYRRREAGLKTTKALTAKRIKDLEALGFQWKRGPKGKKDAATVKSSPNGEEGNEGGCAEVENGNSVLSIVAKPLVQNTRTKDKALSTPLKEERHEDEVIKRYGKEQKKREPLDMDSHHLSDEVCHNADDSSTKLERGATKDTKESSHMRSLQNYRVENGHCCIPNGFSSSLLEFIHNLRDRYKSSSLDANTVKSLESIGFLWHEPSIYERNEYVWNSRLVVLKAYIKKFGSSAVPRNWAKDPWLFRWVGTQRDNYRRNKRGKHSPLTPAREEKLNDLGFDWMAPPIESGRSKVENETQIVERHQHVQKDRSSGNMNESPLGTSFGRKLRSSSRVGNATLKDLNRKTERVLEQGVSGSEIPSGGMVRQVKKRNSRVAKKDDGAENDDFSCRLNELRSFREQYGHTIVSQGINAELYNWTSTQRQKYASSSLRQNEVEALEELGFTWPEMSQSERNSFVWQLRFKHLAAYKKEFGHTACIKEWEKGPALHRWVRDQRDNFVRRKRAKRSPLTNERIKQLNGIGFQWNTKSAIAEAEALSSVSKSEPKVCSDDTKQLLPETGGAQGEDSEQTIEGGSRPEANQKGTNLSDYEKTEGQNVGGKQMSWEDRLSSLAEFKDRFGSTRVAHGPGLGYWVSEQRRDYSRFLRNEKSPMTAEKVSMLEALGFEWVLTV